MSVRDNDTKRILLVVVSCIDDYQNIRQEKWLCYFHFFYLWDYVFFLLKNTVYRSVDLD